MENEEHKKQGLSETEIQQEILNAVARNAAKEEMIYTQFAADQNASLSHDEIQQYLNAYY